MIEAAEQLASVAENKAASKQLAAGGLRKLVADKGCHSNEVMEDLTALKIHSYISEPNRGGGTGGTKQRHEWRCTGIGDASEASAASACSGSAARGSNAALRIYTRRAG